MIIQTSPELDEKLAKACEDAGVADPLELIRRAVSLYVFIAEQRVTGNEFVMRDPQGDYHIVKVL